jgi:CHAT domain-containing protein/uncharacterized protein YfcZ (UPF0381/DUF406 family)
MKRASSQLFSVATFLKRGATRLVVLFSLGLLLSCSLPALSQGLVVQPADQLVEQGRVFYTNQQFDQAVIRWQQAAQRYAEQEDDLHQAMALTYLSLAHQQQAQWSEAETAIHTSLQLLQSNHDLPEQRSLYAQALSALGRLQLSQGQPEAALETWQRATESYEQLQDETGITGSLLNQAQALEGLGMYRRSCQTLLRALQVSSSCDRLEETEIELILQTFAAQSDRTIQLLGLRSVGNVLRLGGNLAGSREVLQQGLEIARSHSMRQFESAILLELGETERSLYSQIRDLASVVSSDTIHQVQAQAEITLDYYQQAAQAFSAAPSNLTAELIQLQALIQHLNLNVDLQQWLNAHAPEIESQIQPSIEAQIAALTHSSLWEFPPTRTLVYAQLSFVQSLMRLGLHDRTLAETALRFATSAQQNAEKLSDIRAQSYTLGTLGQFYEQNGDWAIAQQFTQSALQVAQAHQAEDIAYRWQWQLGRLYQARGETHKAIENYELAFNTLRGLRQDLAALNPAVQFSFREDVEPVYRQLVDLLLQEGHDLAHLQQARTIIDALQVAEVENFLQQACANAELAAIDQVIDQTDPTAAFIYTIILDDRLEVILKLPQSDQLQTHTVALSRSEVEQQLAELRRSLQQKLPSRLPDMQQRAQQVYNWLIAPFSNTLTNSTVKTLVFVLDGSLRNIPMAALYDGEAYLIQRYGVAIAPGLELLNPTVLNRNSLQALIAGATEAAPELGFPGLPGVEVEVDSIQRTLSTSDVLLNQAFTSEALSRSLQLKSVPIVHIATHGQFSSRAEDTFILAGNGDRITSQQLSELLNLRQYQPTPIELLFLSACQTVTGDKRAALGMAGVAIQSGARSTIASLWYADDEASAELVAQFYQFLTDPQVSTKAEALRLAQQALLSNPKFSLPVYWSLYILLGNWL